MSDIFAVAAEFDDEHQLLDAARKAREAGFSKIEAYSPFPIHGMQEAIGYKRPILAWVIFAGGVAGMIGGFYLCYWISVLELPYNIGGRPLNSWPSFIPITFECTVLAASLTAVFGMFAFNGLPLPYHPMFNHPNFERCSQDKFFLTIESGDPMLGEAHNFLKDLSSYEVIDVER